MRSFLLLIALVAFTPLYASAAENQSGENKTANPSATQAKRKPQNQLNKNTTTSEPNKKTKSTVDRGMEINNEGVMLLNEHDFKGAISKFEESIRVYHYGLARENLAIAYNNLGLQLKDNPNEAIKQFHKAMFCDPNNSTTKANLDGLIRSFMGKNPDSFKDRAELGDQARLNGDMEGSVIEYQAALSLQHDAEVQKKLNDLLNGMAKGTIKTCSPPHQIGEHYTPGVEFGPYIDDVQKRVQHCGPVLQLKEPKRVIAICTIARSGKLLDVHLDHTPAASGADQAALAAVRKAAPFPPLPPGSPENITIQLTLDYKVHSVEIINGSPSNNAN